MSDVKTVHQYALSILSEICLKNYRPSTSSATPTFQFYLRYAIRVSYRSPYNLKSPFNSI